MGKKKRKSNDGSGVDLPNKRSRQDVPGRSYGQIDPTTGQRSAFPGLDDYSIEDEDAELDYGDDDGALSYLRAVRREAEGIPAILVAPKSSETSSGELDRSIYDDGIGDTRGYYEDGAYTARPAESEDASDDLDEEGTRDPQIAYFDKIIERYNALRDQLSLVPPRHAVERLDSDHTFYMAHSSKAFRLWRWRLIHTDPETAQLASMESNAVLKLLRILGEHTFLKREGMKKRTSRWIWGLLAKAPHRGELTSEQIGILRELGKKAVWMTMRLKGVNMDALEDPQDQDEEEEEDEAVDIEYDDVEDYLAENEPRDEDNDEELGLREIIGPVMPAGHAGNGGNESGNASASKDIALTDYNTGDVAEAKKRLLARLTEDGDDEVDQQQILVEQTIPQAPATGAADDEGYDLANVRATIDMILTVTGELYGQRDLLEFREVWA